MKAHLFIRNDDAVTLDREFCYYVDLAKERGVPIVHAVIPGKMDSGLVRFMNRAKEKSPHLLDIVQHGWMHTNYSIVEGIKYEFGKLRSLKEQREDILQGLKMMRRAFGENFTPAFVPPYHGYDKNTLLVLREEGFRIFSAGTRRAEVKKSFIEIPAQVSFSRYEQGQKSIYESGEVMAQVIKGIHRRSLSGVLTHHKDFKGALYRRELTRFFDCVAALKEKKEWRVLLFSEILSGLN